MDALSQPLIAVRIKDGIFVGNVTAAHDEDFLFMNKVTHVVNCAGCEVKDLYEEDGIKYLNFPWKDTSGGVCTTVMFDSGDRNIDQAVRFIDQAIETGECVLVHSFYGVSRSCALVAAYLMVKYGWRLDNALQFLTMAHPDTNIKQYFLRQLRTFAKRHNTEVDVFHEDVDDGVFGLDNDQWMLRNTLLNGLTHDAQAKNPLYKQCADNVPIQEANYKNQMKRRRRLVFVDTKQGTSVGGGGTTPVSQPKPHYVDPLSGNFSGKMGCNALRAGQPEAILARRGTPNTRTLESQPESQPKGRQVLYVKKPPVPEQPPVQQLPPGQYPIDRREQMTVHNREALPSPRDRVAPSPQAAPAPSPQQYNSAPLRSNPMNARAAATSNDGGVGSDRLLPGSNTPPPRAGSGGTNVRSPFNFTTGGGRRGSPLPKPRTPTSHSSSAAANTTPASSSNVPSTQSLRYASPQAIPTLHQARESGTRNGTPTRGGTPTGVQQRANSPMSRTSLSSRTPQSNVPRTNSPMRGPGSSTVTSSGYGAGPSSTTVRRTNSPMSRTSNIPNAHSTISHETIRNMAQPQSAVRSSGYGQQPGASAYRASTGVRTSSPMTNQPRTSSPLSRGPTSSSGGFQRTSSPMSRQNVVTRNDSPTRGPISSSRSSGYNSTPTRGATNLAEQYLGMGPVTSTGSGSSGAPRVARETNASILRRQQNMSISAHR